MTDSPNHWTFIRRVALKTAFLLLIANLAYMAFDPLPIIAQLTLHNRLLPGRERLPYGESPDAYNLTLNSVEAMLATHTFSRADADAFRVWVFGDSSVWGMLLNNDETLTGHLNAAQATLDGRRLRAENLGHPLINATKDLMLMDAALNHAPPPDLIVWLLTLDALPRSKQLDAPLVQHNPTRINRLIDQHALPFSPLPLPPPFPDQTLFGQRRALADWWRLQLYSVAWAQTGIDQAIPATYTPRSNDFDADATWQYLPDAAAALTPDLLALDVIHAAHTLAGKTPLLLINEPIFIADGANSHLRYNAWYPRTVYDAYRAVMTDATRQNQWYYLDLWDRIPATAFTDSPVHLSPQGSKQLSDALLTALHDLQKGDLDRS